MSAEAAVPPKLLLLINAKEGLDAWEKVIGSQWIPNIYINAMNNQMKWCKDVKKDSENDRV